LVTTVVLLQDDDEDENEDEEEEEDPLLHVNLGNKMFQHMFSVSSLEGTDNARSDDNISSVGMAIVTELMDSFVHSMFTSC
jgi:hypothetical protein